jgi:hypothetical protein
MLGSSGRTFVRGKKQSMGSKAVKALKRAEREGFLLVCEVNESWTSKVKIYLVEVFIQPLFY